MSNSFTYAGTKSRKKIRVLYVFNSCKNRGPTKVVLNIIKNLNLDKYEPVILTLSEETEESSLKDFTPYISKHIFTRVSKTDILLGRLKKLVRTINEIKPDVIHATGVFPDYAISKTFAHRQIITMHNYAPVDYIAKFGLIRGSILKKLQFKAVKLARKTVACSESLTELYRNNNLRLKYIRNGTDIKKYSANCDKNIIKRKLRINKYTFIFIYTGHLSTEKNVSFVIENFSHSFDNSNIALLVLGDGKKATEFKKTYESFTNIIFTGKVPNVEEYLKASDVYISASRTEGMPNGVLEAIASGLPVLLSDIPQHREILEVGKKCGYSFSLDDKDDLCKEMKSIQNDDLKTLSKNARATAEKFFDSAKMSKEYQKIYQEIASNA